MECFFRNTNKNGAMDYKHFAVFFLKVICDASFKIWIFFAFMCTYNEGQFSTKMTVTYFYGVAVIIMFGVFMPSSSDRKYELSSLRHWIGR